MTALPSQYAWLAREPGPKMLLALVGMYGAVETPGARDNPEIMRWAKELGLGKVYTHDSVAWCGLAMAWAAKQGGKEIPDDPLWALNWRKFGKPADKPMLGDVMVKKRDGGGHVTMYVGEDAVSYHCIGGNQSDRVNIARIAKKGVAWYFRRPLYNVQPANVRVVKLAAGGAPIGGSEA